MSQERELLHKDSYFNGIILAGGESKRFGSDKCEFEIDGKTMLERVVENFENPIIVSRKPRKINGIQVFDYGKGPVSAVVKALEYVNKDKVFITGCDFPYLKRRIIEFICNKNFDIVMPIIEYPQPLLGCYKVNVLKEYSQILNSFLQLIGKSNTYLIGTEELLMIDPTLKSVKNINTLMDFYSKPIKYTKSILIFKN